MSKSKNTTILKFQPNRDSGFTLVELMITVAILGVLAVVAMTGFQAYVMRSKTGEAYMALDKIVTGELEYFGKNQTFLAAGPTNIPPPAATTASVDFSADNRWTQIGFAITTNIYFGYQVTLAGNTADCDAMADLNGDGITSLFRRRLTSSGTTATAGEIYIFDELE
jgi:prepilin-type N-terminal cleavage/methylation domain-containing protein